MTHSPISVLAVDLDGALLKGDLLYECFWAALARDRRTPLAFLRALSAGRAPLTRHLLAQARIDVTTLPFDETVLDYVRRFCAAGGRAVLVTATDEGIAERIAHHVGLFDEVCALEGRTDPGGDERAARLERRYGAGHYAYLGAAGTDLAPWRHAGRAVTLNATPALRDAVAGLAPEVEHLTSERANWRDYLRALRPHQWLKNVLVFMPMLAAHDFTAGALLASLLAFFAFSIMASSAYVLNDLLDLSADRAHPRKRNRPFAAGRIRIVHGVWMGGGLLLGGMSIAVALGGPFLLVMLSYYLLTTAYSLDLKRRAIIDICVLAGLYTLRILAGGVATGLELSVWMLAFAMFFFLALAAVKRQAELVDTLKRSKPNAAGRDYSVDDLPIISMMAISAGYVSVLVMALYVNAPATQRLYSMPEALWGICCILLYWISRTVMLAHRGAMDDDPVVYAVKDPISRLSFLASLGFTLTAKLL
jgi:4-hydroxybenzoate polyprenyltransferase